MTDWFGDLNDRTAAGLSAPLPAKHRPELEAPQHVLKVGNLFNPIPDDVPYHGCSDKDCISGCNLGKGHCQRLEDAFRMAGYET